MAGLFVKKGDTVLVRTGKDRGARGKVLLTSPSTDRVLVEGVNRVKKHTKISAGQRGAKQGGIVTQEAAIHVSNVQVVDADGQRTKVGYETNDEGAKSRVSRRTGKEL
jgi:large subunit ribosomal protein L24